MLRALIFIAITLVGYNHVWSQSFFEPADTFNTKRFITVSAIGGSIYTGMSLGLYHAWYKKQDLGSFHFFNDNGEWMNMDKFGHAYTAYMQGTICYKGAKWAGVSEKNSIWAGILCGVIFQSTLETMDGFSNKWGFSKGDMIANVSGTALFATQQIIWKEQRLKLKYASYPPKHPNSLVTSIDGTATTTILDRSKDLFGTGFFERALKDYNGQSYWVSVNIASFFGESRWPKWLNIAIGTGAESMYGGFKNEWTIGSASFELPSSYNRYRQFYISPDIDFSELKTNNSALKTLFSIFNVFKCPAPALEINTKGEIVFHLFR
ncbi:MAG: DUF2279 domain-containing protein [Saprospiraceae bacterium]|nr:DUF2279 domain-containing protein [Saprospiraceae bacterium]